MKFFSELSLLLFLTLAPLLFTSGITFFLSLPDTWLLFSCLWSIVFATVTVLRTRQRFVRPLRRLIENLYANAESSHPYQTPELRQLDRAIRLFSAARNLDATIAIEGMEKTLHDAVKQQEREKKLLQHERELLRISRQDIDTDTSDLEMRTELVNGITRKVLASANANTLDTETLTDLEDLQFLVEYPNTACSSDSHDLMALIDRVISVTAPLARRQKTSIYTEFAHGCPRQFVLDANHFKACLFHLLVQQLKGSQIKQIYINIEYKDQSVIFTFPGSSPLPDSVFSKALSDTGASWTNSTLTFPVARSIPDTQLKSDLTAIVIADQEKVRLSLVQRLGFLGVTCSTGFGNQALDICVVADETSEAFLAIKSYLPETTFVLMLNNHRHYPQPRWITVKDPVTQFQLQQLLASISRQKSISDQQSDSGQKSVLVVDDSEVNIQLLEIQLKELGHNVTIAHTGEVAVSMTERRSFDMIFMDIQMPGIGGMEATRKIRQLDQSVTVIGLTAHVTSGEKQQCLASGMNEVLTKPIRMENLRGAIRREKQSDGPRPIAAAGQNLPIFDMDLSLKNANERADLAAELFELLITELPQDLEAINASSGNHEQLARNVHKLHGAVRYCGVPRLAKAIQSVEIALKQNEESQVTLLLNLLNGEATALFEWHRHNPDVLSPDAHEIRRH